MLTLYQVFTNLERQRWQWMLLTCWLQTLSWSDFTGSMIDQYWWRLDIHDGQGDDISVVSIYPVAVKCSSLSPTHDSQTWLAVATQRNILSSHVFRVWYLWSLTGQLCLFDWVILFTSDLMTLTPRRPLLLGRTCFVVCITDHYTVNFESLMIGVTVSVVSFPSVEITHRLVYWQQVD